MQWQGTSENEVVFSTQNGNDTIDGGAGTDTAIFSGAFSGYKLGYANGSITVNDSQLSDGNDGSDTLSNVEILRFSNTDINLSTFDANWYLAKYSDLRSAFGTNSSSALNHYLSDGIREGRSGDNSTNDLLTGSAFADTLYGYDGHDNIKSGDGNDSVTGGNGNDTIDGGAGTDTAIFSGAFSGYKLGYANGSITVNDSQLSDGNDGSDTLSNVEILRFGSDTVIDDDLAEALFQSGILNSSDNGTTTLFSNDHLIRTSIQTVLERDIEKIESSSKDVFFNLLDSDISFLNSLTTPLEQSL